MMQKLSIVFLLVLWVVGCAPNQPVAFEDSPEFKQTVQRLNFGQAVMLYEKQLQEPFWQNLNFEQ